MATIIKDYTKITDAQLESNIFQGYEEAIAEGRRRGWTILTPGLYRNMDGKYHALRTTLIARTSHKS